jgi:hypothetical protein
MGKKTNAMLDALMSWDGKTRVWTPTTPDVKGSYSPKAITGELIRVEEWETENGPVRVAILADDLDGQETAVYTNSVVLNRAWEDYRPRIGDRIGVAFGGKEEGKNNRSYSRYRMLVERCTHNGPPAEVTQPDVDPATGEIKSLRKDPFVNQ